MKNKFLEILPLFINESTVNKYVFQDGTYFTILSFDDYYRGKDYSDNVNYNDLTNYFISYRKDKGSRAIIEFEILKKYPKLNFNSGQTNDNWKIDCGIFVLNIETVLRNKKIDKFLS